MRSLSTDRDVQGRGSTTPKTSTTILNRQPNTQRDRTHMDRSDAVRDTQHPQSKTTTTYPKARSRVHVQELSITFKTSPSDAD
ncbi:hypothetical protein D9611_014069 [Ephemerocybe angulata]|uniref:Uncharacterized protein n=1 Tax=Ephemerocybe angulata TaxID=980116 RepID=A0A8H5ASY8_9AGAR|nr:hypothetical protein D9611_014065 [Tulosesus angulatus]KAF5309682.1 hypothetical protein D9611_014069 [Tulosesus angulatus]